MTKTVLKTKEAVPDKAVLIIDKVGAIGEALAREFSKDFYVVFLSARKSQSLNKRVCQIIFKGKIPKVPQSRYSKIYLIDDGDSVTRQSSTSFIKEAERINSDFYFLGSIRNYDLKNSDEIVKAYDKAKVLIFGDLFDNDLFFDSGSSITKFIISASNRKLINVPNDGLSLSFPMAFEDTVKLIIKASYLKIEEKIILLFYKNPITDISLAHIFQKIDPEIRVDFIKDKNEKNIFIPEGAEFAISKYDIKNKIEEINLNKKRKVLVSKKRKNTSGHKFLKLISVITFLLLFIFFLPLITSITYDTLGKIQVQKSFELAKENNFNEALDSIQRANSFFQISSNANAVLSRQLEMINVEDNFENLLEDKYSKDEGFTSASNLFTGLTYLKNIIEGKSVSPDEDFKDGINFLKKSYTGNMTSKLPDEDPDVNLTIEFISTVSEVLPQVMGFNNEKKYLILFQDSTQLTPGGGKIVAVGRINLNNGKVTKLEIISSNELNDNSSVKIEPPYFIKRYLKEDNLILEKSNYDVDFVANAIGATSIYSLKSNEEIDGVIGVDAYFLKNLLEITGPVNIRNINKNISAENLIQTLAENDEKVFTNVVKEIFNDYANISYLNFLGLIGKMISENHLMFSFKDTKVQSFFEKNNFSGSLIDNRLETTEKINDFLGISEYNIGLNNINYFISRSVDKKNIINEDRNLESELTISYKNSSERGKSFAKTYKTYIQLILPIGSVIEGISVGGRNEKIISAVTDPNFYESENFNSLDGIEVEQKEANNKSIFGFAIGVEPDSIEKIKIKYSLPFALSNSSNNTSYSLAVYKQPGIDSFPFILSFANNPNYAILPSNSAAKEIKKDEEFNFKISEK